MRVDFHTHFVPPLPDFGERFGDKRWPSFSTVEGVGRLTRDGAVVRAVPPAAWSLDDRLADMGAARIDRQVLSPLPPLICDWADAVAGAEWCARLNDGIAEAVAKEPRRFLGLGSVPLQHPNQAVEVLSSARDAGLVGVEIGTTAGEHELDHPDLREFFSAAAELGMIVFIHPLILGANSNWTDRIVGQEVTFGLGMTTDSAIAAAKLAFGGVTEENPDLKVCLSHGGGSFPWVLPRIAKAWDMTHDSRVSELTRNIFVDSVVYSPDNLRYLNDVLGSERVVFGTDYPLPAQDDLHGGVLGLLSEDDRRRVAGANLAGLFGRESA